MQGLPLRVSLCLKLRCIRAKQRSGIGMDDTLALAEDTACV